MEETNNNFKGVRLHVHDWNYETVIEHEKDAWKTSRTFVEGHKKVALIPC